VLLLVIRRFIDDQVVDYSENGSGFYQRRIGKRRTRGTSFVDMREVNAAAKPGIIAPVIHDAPLLGKDDGGTLAKFSVREIVAQRRSSSVEESDIDWW
jgi:hypothetical protein